MDIQFWHPLARIWNHAQVSNNVCVNFFILPILPFQTVWSPIIPQSVLQIQAKVNSSQYLKLNLLPVAAFLQIKYEQQHIYICSNCIKMINTGSSVKSNT